MSENKGFIVNEPRLEDIEDYDTLKGEKRKVVWIVVLSALFIGVITYIAFETSTEKEDSVEVEKSFKQVPMK